MMSHRDPHNSAYNPTGPVAAYAYYAADAVIHQLCWQPWGRSCDRRPVLYGPAPQGTHLSQAVGSLSHQT
ncbi:MAG: hypothetical protein GAK38_02563 [Xylophilus sp.]|nr:MAG: hypothetical protein GAK38_02563 [Xylophilus sp.]